MDSEPHEQPCSPPPEDNERTPNTEAEQDSTPRRGRLFSAFLRIARRRQQLSPESDSGDDSDSKSPEAEGSVDVRFERARMSAEGVNQAICFVFERVANLNSTQEGVRDVLQPHLTLPQSRKHHSSYTEWVAGIKAGPYAQTATEGYRTPVLGEDLGNLVIRYPLRRSQLAIPLYNMDVTLRSRDTLKAADGITSEVTAVLSFNTWFSDSHPTTHEGTPLRSVIIETDSAGDLKSISIAQENSAKTEPISLQGLSCNLAEVLRGIEARADDTAQAFQSITAFDEPEGPATT